MINYYWQVQQLDTIPQEGGLQDVVSLVHWTRVATTEIDGKQYVANTWGIMECATPSSTDFTAYPDLTQEQVFSWLDSGLDVVTIDEELTVKIDDLTNPPLVVLPLPWANQE